MQVETAEYQGHSIRYAVTPENGVLFNTVDLLRALNCSERPAGSYLSEPSLDLVGAIGTAFDHDEKMADWLAATFSSYDAAAQHLAGTDDDWSNL